MNYTSSYFIEDVEKFLLINKELENSQQSKSLKKLLSVQHKISIFKNINPHELKAIVYDLKFIKYSYKDYIVKQDDMDEEMFFIIKGECQVFHDNQRVGTLEPGEVFGESGAVFKTKRNASVICSSEDVTLLSFKIDGDNLEFCAQALALLYKNLAFEINAKLEDLNITLIRK
jgi:CRP-like cAMP-binding protein